MVVVVDMVRGREVRVWQKGCVRRVGLGLVSRELRYCGIWTWWF